MELAVLFILSSFGVNNAWDWLWSFPIIVRAYATRQR